MHFKSLHFHSFIHFIHSYTSCANHTLLKFLSLLETFESCIDLMMFYRVIGCWRLMGYSRCFRADDTPIRCADLPRDDVGEPRSAPVASTVHLHRRCIRYHRRNACGRCLHCLCQMETARSSKR